MTIKCVDAKNKQVESYADLESGLVQIVNCSPVPACLSYAHDGTICHVNQSLLNCFGYELKEMKGYTSLQLGILPSFMVRKNWINLVMKNGTFLGFQTDLYTKNEIPKNMKMNATHYNMGDKDYIILFLDEIQHNKPANEHHRATNNDLDDKFSKKLLDIHATLTPRELEICKLIKNGLPSKNISQKLFISPVTVERHRSNIRNKLALNNTKTSLSIYLQSL